MIAARTGKSPSYTKKGPGRRAVKNDSYSPMKDLSPRRRFEWQQSLSNFGNKLFLAASRKRLAIRNPL